MMMTNMFTGIGIATVSAFGFLILLLVVDFIVNEIHEAIWVYKYRHRFDKPPTAACYCIDCKFHGDSIDSTRCTKRKDIVLQTADEWFCQAAEPKERED